MQLSILVQLEHTVIGSGIPVIFIFITSKEIRTGNCFKLIFWLQFGFYTVQSLVLFCSLVIVLVHAVRAWDPNYWFYSLEIINFTYKLIFSLKFKVCFRSARPLKLSKKFLLKFSYFLFICYYCGFYFHSDKDFIKS